MNKDEYKKFVKNGQDFQANQNEENNRNKQVIHQMTKDRKIQMIILCVTGVGLFFTMLQLFMFNRNTNSKKFFFENQVIITKSIYECNRQELEFYKTKKKLEVDAEYLAKLNECNRINNKSIYFKNLISPECILKIDRPFIDLEIPEWEKEIVSRRTITRLVGIKIFEKNEDNISAQNIENCVIKNNNNNLSDIVDAISFDTENSVCINFEHYNEFKNSNNDVISWQVSVENNSKVEKFGLRNKNGSISDKFAYKIFVVDPKGNINIFVNALESDSWSYNEYKDMFGNPIKVSGGVYKILFSVFDKLVACTGLIIK